MDQKRQRQRPAKKQPTIQKETEEPLFVDAPYLPPNEQGILQDYIREKVKEDRENQFHWQKKTEPKVTNWLRNTLLAILRYFNVNNQYDD